jgi:hypothetical protein
MPKKDLKCFENLITLIRELRNRLSFYMPFFAGVKERKYLAEGISANPITSRTGIKHLWR